MIKDNVLKATALLLVVVLTASSVGLVTAVSDAEEEPEPDVTGLNVLQRALIFIGDLQYATGDMFYNLAGAQPRDVPDASDDSVKAFARELVRQYAAEDFTTLCVAAAGLVDNNARTWNLAESYTARAAEIAAGTYWSAGGTYDPEAILLAAGVYALAADSVYNTDVSLGYAVRNMADRLDSWDGAYSSITESIRWDNGGTTGECTEACLLHFASVVKAADGQRVYFGGTDADHPTVWNLTSSPMTMTSQAGTAVTLSPGANVRGDADPIPDGWYTLSAGTCAGLFLPSPGERSAKVTGGAVVEADGRFGYAVPEGDKLSVAWNGVASQSSVLRFSWTSDGATAQTQVLDGTCAVADLIRTYSDQTRAISGILAKSAQAGQVMWTISAAAGKANILLSPSSISPQLVDAGVDAIQVHAMYVSALSQISDYYQTYGAQLQASQTRVSAESLQLYVRGSLHNSDGTAIVSDVVFTPYVYLNNMTVVSGQNNTFAQDGICMVWTSEGFGQLSGFSGSDASSQRTVVMPKGCYFAADEISYGGHAVTDVTLHVKEVGRIDMLSDIGTVTPEPPKVLSAATLCMIIVLEAAALVAVVGVLVRAPALWVVALILALVGVLAKDWIAGLLLGFLGV